MNKKHGIIGLIIALLFGGGYAANELGGNGPATRLCDVSTVAIATVGFETVAALSTQLLSTSSLRAWARIQQPASATNTIAVSFNEDQAAALEGGLLIGDHSATNTPTFIDFGLNTDFPYTGAVRGLADKGTTTVHVTQCNYR